MVPTIFDLDPYFDRIGYKGLRSPTEAVLRQIVERHALVIPFENLDVLLGRGVRLDVEAIQHKQVRSKRGGYCFERNALLAGVLRQLGFVVTTLAARVRWMVPVEISTPRTHMLLSVKVDDVAYLADVGFGGVGLTAPLRMETDGEQPTLYEPQRIVQQPNQRLLQAKISGEWRDLYVFTDEPQEPVDYELANWFTSAHPASRFRQNLIASKAHSDGRYVLFNRELSAYRASGIERTTIDDPERLLEVLAARFGLSFPAGTRFGAPGSAWPS